MTKRGARETIVQWVENRVTSEVQLRTPAERKQPQPYQPPMQSPPKKKARLGGQSASKPLTAHAQLPSPAKQQQSSGGSPLDADAIAKAVEKAAEKVVEQATEKVVNLVTNILHQKQQEPVPAPLPSAPVGSFSSSLSHVPLSSPDAMLAMSTDDGGRLDTSDLFMMYLLGKQSGRQHRTTWSVLGPRKSSDM